MPIEYKEIPLECKAVKEDGQFEGYLSTFGNVDAGNDMVHPGAYKKTLRENKKFPFLWQHDRWSPIGSFTGKEDNYGLKIKGQLNLMTTEAGVPKIPDAHRAHALMLEDNINGLSIGYDPVKWDEEADKKRGKIRHLREIRLWEGSLITFPMNANALITDVKTMRMIKDIKHMIDIGVLTKEQIIKLFESDDSTQEEDIRDESIIVNHYPKLKEALQLFRKEVKKL